MPQCAAAGCTNALTGTQRKYCSVPCAGRSARPKILPTEGPCEECGKVFPFTGRRIHRFCSKSCGATFANRGKSRAVDPMKRIAARVDKQPSGCWHYAGSHRGGDQRRPHIGSHGKTLYVHRVLWEDANGPIPAGHEIHHTCFDHRCINPAHFALLTISEHRRLHARRRHNTE